MVQKISRAGERSGTEQPWCHCMLMAKVSNKTAKRQLCGAGKRPRRSMQARRRTLVACIPKIKVSNKTTKRQSRGTDVRPSRDVQGRSLTLVACTPIMRVSRKVLRRRCSGFSWQLSKAVKMRAKLGTKITAGAFRFFRTVARLLCSARAPCNAASRGCWRMSDASQPIYVPLERAGRSSTAKWKRGSGLQLGAVSQ